MFVDTSVVIAILSKESDARDLAARIEGAKCLSSPLVVLEAVMRLTTKLALEPRVVELEVLDFLDQAQISLVPLDRETVHLAVQAFANYGKGRGHPAKLNIADCLSYACAKQQGVPLLYKGEDFVHTDLG